LGLIPPIYAIIDMVETAENVWSDSCVCAMTNKAIQNSTKNTETPNDSNEPLKERGEQSEDTKE
jgi:Na+/H+-dicarboxylate symporter